MCEYDGLLYLGTNTMGGGGELWRTEDGENWTFLVDNNNLHTNLNGAHFANSLSRGDVVCRGGIRSMAVYNGELYLGYTGEDMRWSINLFRLGKIFSVRQAWPFLIHPFKRLTSMGCEIWKFNASTEKFTKVIGGILGGNSSGGFGDVNNDYPWTMMVHNDGLYVGTSNMEDVDFVFRREGLFKWSFRIDSPKGGAELWRFDGDCWEIENEKGFGNEYNIGIRILKMFNNSIFAGTMNTKSGCEVWKYEI
jgi:hypothetical protein